MIEIVMIYYLLCVLKLCFILSIEYKCYNNIPITKIKSTKSNNAAYSKVEKLKFSLQIIKICFLFTKFTSHKNNLTNK